VVKGINGTIPDKSESVERWVPLSNVVPGFSFAEGKLQLYRFPTSVSNLLSDFISLNHGG
jgi:hypothetical protein